MVFPMSDPQLPEPFLTVAVALSVAGGGELTILNCTWLAGSVGPLGFD